jgi:WD40 repeat protein
MSYTVTNCFIIIINNVLLYCYITIAEAAALAAIMQGEGGIDSLIEKKEADQMMQTFRAHDNNIWDMQIRPKTALNGDLIIATASTFNELKFWRVKHKAGSVQTGDLFYDFGEPVQDYVGHGGPVTSTALFANDTRMISVRTKYFFIFSPYFLSFFFSFFLIFFFHFFASVQASEDYNIYVYDTHRSSVIKSWNYNGSVYRIVVDPAEKYVYAGGTAYTICCYALNEPYEQVAELHGHAGKVVSLAITNDGNLLASAAHDFNINLWNIQTNYQPNSDGDMNTIYPFASVVAHLGHVVDLQFAGPGRNFLASCSNDHQVKCWKVTGKTISETWNASEAHTSVVSSICWGRDETADIIFSGGWDGEVKAWRKGECIGTMSAHLKRVYEVMCNNDGTLLFSAGKFFKFFVQFFRLNVYYLVTFN